MKGTDCIDLIGPNSAGKSTTFHMMVGLLPPDEGQVILNDEDLTAVPIYERARELISYLPQESSVYRLLTVEENLLVILQTLDLSSEQQQERSQALIFFFSISPPPNLNAFPLPGGFRR